MTSLSNYPRSTNLAALEYEFFVDISVFVEKHGIHHTKCNGCVLCVCVCVCVCFFLHFDETLNVIIQKIHEQPPYFLSLRYRLSLRPHDQITR